MSQFDEIWMVFNEKLLYYIQSKVGNEHDAEDILQIVFLKVYKGFESLENKEALKPWLYQITRNSIIDFYKKKKEISLAPESLPDIVMEEDPDNMNDEIAGCLKKMLYDIPDKYQDVYRMYEDHGMKHKEISDELGISVSASKVRLKRARDLFKKKLLDCCDFETDLYGNIIDYTSKIDCKNC
ncbi:RNA polymerase sigma factor SigZ [Acidaminobacter sp. JC074]|uniref:RNA polymerase sigma factor SigZ n=1 Tax=Acidaminobacter sp. JC074 TaxID=2530199 RepID=UPI001F11251C|nr:RNA polymerase sigma factor SigZ [Acidaminobacter sp. JC074]MCH4888380.1 RNA polymerase sigma factor SigZ [Acidaminobacter sp. JC074]